MKEKRFLSCVMLSLFAMVVLATNPLEVKRFKQWGHEYLTVSNNWNGLFAEVESGELPPVMALITAINGQSTKSMSVEAFDKIMSKEKHFIVDYIEKDEGVNKEKTVVFKSNKGYLAGMEKVAPDAKPATVNINSDSDIDFFDYNTYDFIIEGNDKLTDKEIYENLAIAFENRGLKRSTENPDLIFKVEKTFNQHSNSTYVPETRQIVNAGSTTTSWRDKKGNIHFNTYQNNRVVSSGGYTQTTNSTAMYLLFVAYDGKKYREDPSSTPIVWKLDYNGFFGSFVDMMSIVKTEVLYWCSSYPFGEHLFSHSLKSYGVFFDSKEAQPSGEISKVLEGSDAYNKGLRDGDKIMKIYKGGLYMIFWWQGRRTYFEADSFDEEKTAWWMPAFYIPLPIPFPSKVTQHPYDYLGSDISSCLNQKPFHYKVRGANGQTKKIRARGFQKSGYSYEYIY